MFAKCWKNLKLSANKLKLDFELLPKIFFRRNDIHSDIDLWNRRWFGAKWNVTVPNSVTPVKPMVCKWIYMSQGVMLSNDTQITHMLNFHPRFHETVILSIFIKFMTKNAVFLSFSAIRVKRIIWNQHISVKVHVARILIKTIILKKRILERFRYT